MKKYYVNVFVKYSGNKPKLTMVGVVSYSFTIQADSKKTAELMAKKYAKRDFDNEINKDYKHIKIIIKDSYKLKTQP